MNANRRILHPTDFSATADHALDWAVQLVGSGSLTLLHALEWRGLGADPGKPAVAEVLAERRLVANAELTRRAEGLRGVCAEITTAVVEGVYAGPVVLDAARQADLVVLGRSGERRASGGWRQPSALGSLADEVVRFSERPVVVVPEPGPEKKQPRLARVLVPIDFSSGSRTALSAAVELAGAGEGTDATTLDLLHVIEQPILPDIYALGTDLTAIYPQIELRARTALAALAAELAPNTPTRLTVSFGRPAAEIIAFASANDDDLVVLSHRGLSLLERLLLGTTAEAVVRESTVPSLVVRG